MNLGLYNELMKQGGPNQYPPEWLMFLEICDTYLKKHKIKNPTVVELGIYKNKQKKFYEQLFGAKHIGIDSSIRRSIPDIRGFTEDPKTMETLKKKLRGRPINILFIDASHRYEYVRRDFELYSPLCSDIIAFHDIESGRYVAKKGHDVWKFWNELKETSYTETGKYENFLFISIRQCRLKRGKVIRIGVGMMIKK